MSMLLLVGLPLKEINGSVDWNGNRAYSLQWEEGEGILSSVQIILCPGLPVNRYMLIPISVTNNYYFLSFWNN